MSRTRHHGINQKQRKFGDEWRWLSTCPKDWNKTFHIRPRRAQEHQQIHRALQGEIEQVWPLGNRRPHVYFY